MADSMRANLSDGGEKSKGLEEVAPSDGGEKSKGLEEVAPAAAATGKPNYVFLNHLERKSILIAEAGKRVAEAGWSLHAQTVVVHPPVLAGTATLKFQLKPVGIMHAPYVGFIVNADDYGDVLGNGKTCARLGVEVPVSWGFTEFSTR